ncbi:OmpP1/FadL family transporter [Paraferrimonas haliotis]|uniref:Long-chain fatty acid outer membrane transporter n=1 Tax=Paraferrimonas haliotis TaxID=2013866 RepID=A0AA37WXQ9_9GAMM|nr:outer membrane protein transport protein [Paraferrimonas haliotis]GLS84662.1 long-chain fatty acid outer membrane transporter [Paraferrimonas haliotis]
MKRLAALLALVVISAPINATGLNFWESSSNNSALASANGAVAQDASIIALNPAAMTQLQDNSFVVNATYYSVSTDYNIFGQTSDYQQADPIPAMFAANKLNQHWSSGVAIYSRTAADISIPQIAVLPETRVRPIVVSFAPSIAYQWQQFSFGGSVEYLYGDYQLTQNNCGLLGCRESSQQGNTGGWSGGLSAHWAPSAQFSVGLAHKFASHFQDELIEFDLPQITSAFVSWQVSERLSWHNSFSYSGWQGKGVRYNNYDDLFGLLVGVHNSNRFASAVEYQGNRWSLKGGVSWDEAIDLLGGFDARYRLGLSYDLSNNWQIGATAFYEDYAKKSFKTDTDITLVTVQNRGKGLALSINYRY